ncbi:hypothetical protein [Streptomyces gobiensis]|uniref:hypothetical protein n=1 Tax=Streptomyces gobiensis TaxID=2875706 RepID=UPI001E47AF94|nr:hypothetical protein [Streptomyces gobiensis]UGY90639.1 hypothetical protein test1122_02150 [Streptomyces gobiensis]
MTARAHTRTSCPAASGVGKRLRWWAVVLPVTVFAVLLALSVGGGEARANDAVGLPVAQFLGYLQQSLGS